MEGYRDGTGSVRIEEEETVVVDGDVLVGGRGKERLVFMWGYLPGASRQRAPLLYPVSVRLPPSAAAGFSWRDVCGGGCGFAVAISDTGKLITWGSTDDLGQSYVTSGKHGETPEPFPLPPEALITKAASGWAHCVAVTDQGEVYTWGWKECVPSGKVVGDSATSRVQEKDVYERTNTFLGEQVRPCSQTSKVTGQTVPAFDGRGGGDDNSKRRRVSVGKQTAESSTSSEEILSALPCLVTLNKGVRIATVAAGGRHTLALSDVGQVWGWGYGGEGQLGLGSRIRMVSSPHLIPCTELSMYTKDRSSSLSRGGMHMEGQGCRFPGTYIKGIACGGRHSAVITDAGALLTFGWGLYGQCGQGSTDDEMSPTCVSSLLGIRIQEVAAGLWHTVCISADGDVYSFGGNQFGQLGTGVDQAEVLPRLLDASSIENTRVKGVSCGARHSAVITEEGQVFCWGWNKYGQLGLGDVVDRGTPCEVKIDGCIPKNVACGWWHTLIVAEPT
ncbi:unnamed protein product [Rhodiola kirilowii]